MHNRDIFRVGATCARSRNRRIGGLLANHLHREHFPYGHASAGATRNRLHRAHGGAFIRSFDLDDAKRPLLTYLNMAQKGKTNILVDTVSYNDEVDLTPNGEHPPVILLHCHSWREKPCRHEGPMAGPLITATVQYESGRSSCCFRIATGGNRLGGK